MAHDSEPADAVLEDLSGRLAALDELPLDGHPEVLEDAHRALVAELDGLAAAGGAAPARIQPAG